MSLPVPACTGLYRHRSQHAGQKDFGKTRIESDKQGTPRLNNLTLSVSVDSFALATRFSLSRGSKDVATVVTVTLSDGHHEGRGECVPYARYGESVTSVIDAIRAVEPALSAHLNGQSLQSLMPAGAARNAVDCALWDLRAKQAGCPVWSLCEYPVPGTIYTAYTISLETPEVMANRAREKSIFQQLKLKLGAANDAANDAEEDAARIRAVRHAAPHATLMIDANEGWTVAQYLALLPVMAEANITLIEQPFPATEDDVLTELPRPIALCADESFHGLDNLASLHGKYSVVNIKLDKAGGLTAAMALEHEARVQGFDIMIGCMVASSLGLAPAMLLTHAAKFIDLDASLLLAEDRPVPLRVDGAALTLPRVGLWGSEH